MDAYDPLAIATTFEAHAWQRPVPCGPNSGNCVEVNVTTNGMIGLRDTKIPDSPVLAYDPAEWRNFVAAVKAGQFDL